MLPPLIVPRIHQSMLLFAAMTEPQSLFVIAQHCPQTLVISALKRSSLTASELPILLTAEHQYGSHLQGIF